jgi:hypothetical protein
VRLADQPAGQEPGDQRRPCRYEIEVHLGGVGADQQFDLLARPVRQRRQWLFGQHVVAMYWDETMMP